MAPKSDAVGKTYPPTSYAVGREKVREYAPAMGEETPLYHDVEAARAAGYADVVAPPMFAVVYSWPRDGAGACSTPRSGSTSRAWSTAARSSSGTSRSSRATRSPPRPSSRTTPSAATCSVFTFSIALDQPGGELVCEGTWTNIVR